ncbi:uncharacterized protein B0H18DRAFT_506603 [Fomitopsis serialis]|uniref:uncharacterized protein n=1 Tax=Fomitopsis serialis TaxID=139415 RepID=UPI0020079677|nr:uncharacterized protein B0H18DRAFT_506603 [Neoantrodia serialis]KAH9922619.1 hypothetical protein B0H18DRAFT_506603 [Neoantrodia serialis]
MEVRTTRDSSAPVAHSGIPGTAEGGTVPIDSHSRANPNRLPPELLHKIFVSCIFNSITKTSHYDDRPDGYIVWYCFRILYNMQLVCRHWRWCILTTPSFWSNIEVYPETTSDSFKEILRRSAMLPLKVSFIHAEHLIPHIEPHMHRVQRLRFVSDFDSIEEGGSNMMHLRLFSQPAPVLEGLHLTVDSDYYGPTIDTPRLFDGMVPLMRLFVDWYYLPWPQTHFPHITHLFVKYPPMYGKLSFEEFLDFLGSSPQLEQLVIQGVGPSDLPLGSRKVSLPSLRVVDLTDCDWLVLVCILQQIIPSRSVALSCESPDGVPTAAWSDLLLLKLPDAPFFSRIGSVKELGLWANASLWSGFCFECHDTLNSFTFRTELALSRTEENGMLEAVVEFLDQRFDLSTVEILRLRIGSLSQSIIRTLFESAPAVESLTISVGDSEGVKSEKDAITLLVDNQPMLLPGLKRLRVAKHIQSFKPWMPVCALGATIKRAKRGYPLRNITCTAVSESDSGMVPCDGRDPASVMLDDERVMDFVDELVLECVDDDGTLLDHPKIEHWNGRM